MRKRGNLWLTLLMAVLLAGCPRPLVHPPTSVPQSPPAFGVQVMVPPLQGKVATTPRQIQAGMEDIAVGATVALIDTGTNNTVSSTVTDNEGRFVLTFSSGFVPQSGKTYYLEALKGLPVNGQPNRAGASAARVRTLIAWEPAGWMSLTNADPAGGIIISRATTAIGIISSLRTAANDAPTLAQLIGNVVDGTTFTPSGGIQASEFDTVLGFVNDALSQNIDPLYYVAYDALSRQYLPQPPGVDIKPPSPLKGGIGTAVFIEGTDMGANPEVRFNGVLGTDMVVSHSGVTVKVPAGATSGPLTILIDSLAFNIGNFAVTNWDGHNPFDSQDNLYVASALSDQILRITPAADPSVFAEDARLAYPRGIVVDAQDNVLVSSWNGNQILKVSPLGVITDFSTQGGLIYNPWHLTMDGAGKVYVANYSNDNILVIPAEGGAPEVYATGIGGPSGIAFAPNGELWVTGRIDGKVYKIPAGGGAATVVVGGFSQPTGICFDAAGNAYVTDRDKHQIVRITPHGIATPFAPMSSYPESIAMRTNGTLVVGSIRNYIIEYDAAGEILRYISAPALNQGLTIDSENHLYVTSGHGNGTRTGSVHKATYDPVAGRYGLLKPLATNIPNPHSVAVDAQGTVYVGDYSDGIYRLDKGSSSAYQWARGTGSIGDMAFDNLGRMYAAAWGNHGIYRFDNGVIDKRYGFSYYFRDMARGPDGMLYVTDHWQSKILKVDPTTGELTTFLESGINAPHALAFDASGDLYVGEHGNNRVLKIDMATKAVSVYATGVAAPYGLVFDSTGRLYISDGAHIHLVPANPVTPYSAPQYVTATISGARGLAVDAADNLYVADWSAGAIYKVAKDAGNGGVTTYGTGFTNPYRVISDATGELYAHDYTTRRLYRVPAGGGAAVPLNMEDRGHALGGMVRDPGGTFYFSAYDQPRLYRLDAATGNLDLFAQSPVTPSSLVVVGQSVYGTDWSTGAIFRFDTQTEGFTVVKDTRVTMKGIAVNPLDGAIVVQPWDGRPKVIDVATGAWSDYGSGQYGRGEIAFDNAGDLYSAIYDKADDRAYGNIVRTPAGGGAGVPLHVWFHYGTF